MATNTTENNPPFDCPSWAGKPPAGLHLDVVKGDKLVEFLRNLKAALFCAKSVTTTTRLKSTKNEQIRKQKWVYLFYGSVIPVIDRLSKLCRGCTDTDLSNLTEFNTAHNKRISPLTIEEGNLDIQRPKRKRRNSRVTFSEEDEIINPEDIDPSVGRFRNMVSTAVVPIKKKKLGGGNALGIEETVTRHMHMFPLQGGLYRDLPPASHEAQSTGAPGGATILGGLPLPLPNPAPDVDLAQEAPPPPLVLNPTPLPGPYVSDPLSEPRKKKYAKEAWPGKKPTPSLLI
uniref:Protein phosphatase 1, regulatory subunit 8b n=1 Tax=Cyprinus carpio TaxID=7962 RepID=A0A8C2I3Y4_CYPCA